jgi:tetratricopeptide (TPR) repeat protein
MSRVRIALLAPFLAAALAASAAEHSHPAPEKLGTVKFPTTCSAAVQPRFERAVALLHSFAYTAAEQAFRDVAAADPGCAIAHWGAAMAYFNQLWEPPGPDDIAKAQAEIAHAHDTPAKSARERDFVEAAAVYYHDADHVSPADRAKAYEHAMADVATRYPDDTEAEVFYALALLGTAPLTDRTHANQKHAAEILEPLYRKYPQHPGLAHYLIHAYDSAELAPRGLAAARAYAKIAPSAPHALHMPSHIFTRLGYWDDSIVSNLAARDAARAEGDVGEQLHSMDYLVYAYLQRGRYADAERVVADLETMLPTLPAAKFKIGYAANAMPVRMAVERRQWDAAALLEPLPQSEPHVAAIVYWARAIAHSQSGHPDAADADIAEIDTCLAKLRAAHNDYWATQTDVLADAARAWQLKAKGDNDAATKRLAAAADKEDAIEKRPVTPGPIVPAREQLADMLLALDRPEDALREYRSALTLAPGRRGSLSGAATAAERIGDTKTAAAMRVQLADRQ